MMSAWRRDPLGPNEASPLGLADVPALLGLLGLWMVAVALVGVAGDFPLNDDWAYGLSVRGLIERGTFERVPHIWVPALVHTAVGWLFSAGEFSFESLRASTLCFGFLGVAGCYVLVRQVGGGVGEATLAALVVLANPLYLNLSFTFMSDVSFAALTTWSLVFLLAAARGSVPGLVLGTLCAMAATLERQTGLALPIAFALACIVPRPRDRSAWVASLAVMVTVVACYAVAQSYLRSLDNTHFYSVSEVVTYVAVDKRAHLPFFLVTNGLASLVYLGAFLLPMTWLRRGAHAAGGAALGLLGGALALAAVHRLSMGMPPFYNVIWDLGIGPLTIHGEEGLGMSSSFPWWTASLVGGAAGLALIGVLCARVLPRWREALASPALLLLLAYPAIHLAPHLARSPMFDRYLINCLAPLLAVIVLVAPPATALRTPLAWLRGPGLSLALMAGLFLFSVAGTHDYLERQRTVWTLLEDLESEGIEQERIGGGVEYEGLNTFAAWSAAAHDEEYLLSAVPEKAGWKVVRERSFERWLPPGRAAVWVLHRPPTPE